MKTALITGANSGIGLATVKAFLENDYFVIAHYHSSDSGLKPLANERLHTIKADFTKSEEVRELLAKALAVKGRIDILVNNAALMLTAPSIDGATEDQFDQVFQVNVKAPCLLSQGVLASMKKNKFGRIINLSSVGLKFGGSESTAYYSASKAALEAYTNTLNKACARYNVLANIVRVGVIDTDMHKKIPGKDMGVRAKLIPMSRLGTPEEVANSILFLASDQASFVAGATLTVAGGE